MAKRKEIYSGGKMTVVELREKRKKSQHPRFSAELTKKLSDLKATTADMIEANLKRLSQEFHNDDETPLDFFSFQSISNLAIEGIKVSGELYMADIHRVQGETTTIRGYIEDDFISISDALELLCELENL